MAKNNKLINDLVKIARRNRADNIAKVAVDLTPYVYAGVALALHRIHGWGFKRINRVFLESQRLWEADEGDMIQQCFEETGIRLLNIDEAKREGIENHE